MRNHRVNRDYEIDKPREEIEYDNFYPDLDVGAPMKVYIRGRHQTTRRDILVDEAIDASELSDVEKQILRRELSELEDSPLQQKRSVSMAGGGGYRVIKKRKVEQGFDEWDLYTYYNKKSKYLKLIESDDSGSNETSRAATELPEEIQETGVLPAWIRGTETSHESGSDNVGLDRLQLFGYLLQRRGGLTKTYNREGSEAKTSQFLSQYDMDEQDDYYLSIINKQRVSSGLSYISLEIFEICVTLLEHQWHELDLKCENVVENPQVDRYSSDDGIGVTSESEQPCAICNDNDCDSQNSIVYCDGCDIAVHQECYGVVFIPEGQWLCRRCMHGKNRQVLCEFCPSTTGAFKQTEFGSWAHVVCGLWIPELGFKSNIYMETVDGTERIPKNRWKLVCYICKKRQGACIQCENKNCFQAYHVTCAMRAQLYMHIEGGIQKGVEDKKHLLSLCEKHYDKDTVIEKARLYFKEKRDVVVGKDLVPKYTLEKLVRLLKYFNIEDDSFAVALCKYWTLKRQRKGTSLVKMADGHDTELAVAKIKVNNLLDNDIAKLFNISESIIQRQQLSKKQYNLSMKIAEYQAYPYLKLMEVLLAKSAEFKVEGLKPVVDKYMGFYYVDKIDEFVDDIKLLTKNRQVLTTLKCLMRRDWEKNR